MDAAIDVKLGVILFIIFPPGKFFVNHGGYSIREGVVAISQKSNQFAK